MNGQREKKQRSALVLLVTSLQLVDLINQHNAFNQLC